MPGGGLRPSRTVVYHSWTHSASCAPPRLPAPPGRGRGWHSRLHAARADGPPGPGDLLPGRGVSMVPARAPW